MMFPSKPCYLPIYREQSESLGGYPVVLFTDTWNNFVNSIPRTVVPSRNELVEERLQEWNGTLINDVAVFNTEQDMMWFILRWS